MFREYYYDISELECNFRCKDSGQYIIKHIYHIIADEYFDFLRITDVNKYLTQSVNNLLKQLGEKQILMEDCENIWSQYHIERYFNKHTLYRNEVKSCEKQQLQDPLSESQKQKKYVSFSDEQNDDKSKNNFNILKDSVRNGGTNKDQREREKAELEQKLFENIDKIKDISDVDSYKPLKYIVKFDQMGNITLDNQELHDEDVERLKSKQNNLSFDEFNEGDDIKIKKVNAKQFECNSSESESSEESEDSEEDYLTQQRNLIKHS